MTQAFHHALDGICDDLVAMTALVVEKITTGTEVLLAGDLVGAEAIIGGDGVINDRSHDLEERCYGLLARHQPMASDLRALITIVKVIGDIERSADLVVNICKASRRMYGHEFDPRLRGYIERMGEQAAHLYRLAIDAFADRDAPLAAALDDIDDVLDVLHAEYIQAIFECHSERAISLEIAVQLALVGRFYERIGDHTVNIGERVHFMITGALPSELPGPGLVPDLDTV